MTMNESAVRTEPAETVAARESYTSPARRHYPAPERGYEFDADIQPTSNLFRDRIRWGPVIGGLATATTSMLILSLLGLAIGLTTLNAGDTAATGVLPSNTGTTAAIWGVVAAIVSFFLGGFVAGRTASLFSRGWGSLNGAMVFLIGVPLMLWLAGQGFGTIMGTFSAYAGDLVNQAQTTAQNTTPFQAAQTAEQVRNGAWGILLVVLLGLVSAAIGGSAGTRRHVEVKYEISRIHD
jgi:hypothetical protein